MPGDVTDQYAVIGNPIAHSRSPDIHARFAQATGQSLSYRRIEAPLDGFAAAVDAFRAGGARGLNITAPFKREAYDYATTLAPRARFAGAVNAMRFDGDAVTGENFDGVGLLRDITHTLAMPVTGRRVLILGAGGAARGALPAFLQHHPAQLVLANRTLASAQDLAAAMSCLGRIAAVDYPALTGSFDVVVNATSASIAGGLPPIPATVFAPGCLAYDMAYGQSQADALTPFLSLARSVGVAHLADGVGMLVEQAAEAFAWWRGVRPDTAPVIAALRKR